MRSPVRARWTADAWAGFLIVALCLWLALLVAREFG